MTLEWPLSQLLNNSEVLEKARAERDCLIGYERLVNEVDLSSLRYVQGIIFETLPLNPTAHLLVPHYAFEECKIEGYDVPRTYTVSYSQLP